MACLAHVPDDRKASVTVPVAADNVIHPSAVIGPGVDIGTGNTIGPYAVVLGPTRLGSGNWIGPHACIGTPAQIRRGDHGAGLTAADDSDGVVIGDGNVIREFVTIHQPTQSTTTIGDDCYLMSYAHVPHDARLGDRVTMANSTQVGGHTVIGGDATLGLGVVVHQRRWIGAGAIVGMGSVVTRDVPPFAVATGSPARMTGVNGVGMRRQGYDDTVIQAVSSQLGGESDAAGWALLPPDIQQAFSAYRERNPTRS
jgi:UDP-N-acetylglucosamine acyltransferase